MTLCFQKSFNPISNSLSLCNHSGIPALPLQIHLLLWKWKYAQPTACITALRTLYITVETDRDETETLHASTAGHECMVEPPTWPPNMAAISHAHTHSHTHRSSTVRPGHLFSIRSDVTEWVREHALLIMDSLDSMDSTGASSGHLL